MHRSYFKIQDNSYILWVGGISIKSLLFILCLLASLIGCSHSQHRVDSGGSRAELAVGISHRIPYLSVGSSLRSSDANVVGVVVVEGPKGEKEALVIPKKVGKACVSLSFKGKTEVRCFVVSKGLKKAEAVAKKKKEILEARGENVQEVVLPLGGVLFLDTPFPISHIQLTRPDLFSYRRISEKGRVRELVLIGHDNGLTDLTAFSEDGSRRITYLVNVVGCRRGLLSLETKQKLLKRGAEVHALELKVGTPFELEIPFRAGFIQSLDPQIADAKLKRDFGEESLAVLEIVPLRKGITEVLLYDADQTPRTIFFVKVR